MPDKIIIVSNSDYIHANDQFSMNTFLWYWVCVYMILIVCVTIFNHEINSSVINGCYKKNKHFFPSDMHTCVFESRPFALLPPSFSGQRRTYYPVKYLRQNHIRAWWILTKTWNSIAITFINTSNIFRTFWLLKFE